MTWFRRIIPSVAVALVVAFAMAGCNGSAGMSTTSPSGQGATIQGTVESAGGSAASVGIASAGSHIPSS